jgi:hypothetical protein
MALRDEIAREVRYYGENRGLFANMTPKQIADRILAIPEIAAGQELLRAHGDMLAGGTSYVKVERVDPATVKNLGRSIRVRDPD